MKRKPSYGEKWKKVKRNRPCVLCESTRGCAYKGPDDDPIVVLCLRVPSDNWRGRAGWFHNLRLPEKKPTRRRFADSSSGSVGVRPGARRIDLGRAVRWLQYCIKPHELLRLSNLLRVSVPSLERLRTGWFVPWDAWAFPMSAGSGMDVGICLRQLNGRELLYNGTKQGLFLPISLRGGERLLVVDGPADTAAALDLGFDAVGLSNATGCIDYLVDLVGRLRVPETVIVANADSFGGPGSRQVAARLAACGAAVRVVMPPQDIRGLNDWKIRGATAADVEAAISAAPVDRF